MLWAAYCVENSLAHKLRPAAVDSSKSIDLREASSMVRLRIKQSRTDPFRRGTNVFLGHTTNDICPVTARRGRAGLYSWTRLHACCAICTGGRLTTLQATLGIRTLAGAVSGLDCDTFSGHSFRIGAATTASAKSIEDSTIRTLGQ